MNKIEKELEAYLVAEWHKVGGRALKLIEVGRRGFPDRTLMLESGKIAFVELKTPTGKVSTSQARRIDELREMGLNVYLVTSREEVDRVISIETNRTR